MLKRIVVGAAVAGASWAAYVAVRRWWETWGVDAAEGARPMPGDELVPSALSTDTRGITIDARPEQVWPWLVQMGYGRGGWYSIDQLDMRGPSADRIVPEWQALAVGDVMPTHPGGGFSVKIVEPNRALVLYLDTASVTPPPTAPSGDGTAQDAPMPAGLQASTAFLSATPKQFAASWAFVLEPVGTERTRLIERVRYWGEEATGAARPALAMLGFGVFGMMQRQMVGIRRRAERPAVTTAADPGPAGAEATGNGHAPALAQEVVASGEPA